MKKFLHYILPFVFAATAFTGCTEPGDKTEQSKPTLKINTQNINIPAAGGTGVITYTIENPIEGGEIYAETNADWLYDFITDTEGTISFSAAANTGSDIRNTTVIVTYTSLDRKFTVNVNQDADTDDGSDTFDISINDITATTVSYDVTPGNRKMGYVTMAAKKSVIDKFEDDEALFQSELELFNMLANMQGKTLSEYLQATLRHGESGNIKYDAFPPETECYVYVYGMSEDGERLTDITKKEFKTEPKPCIDYSFKFQYDIIDGVLLQAKAIPQDDKTDYWFGVLRTEGLDLQEGEDIRDKMSDVLQGYLNYVIETNMIINGGSIYDIMDKICYIGVGEDYFDLMNDKEYVLFAAAVELETGLVISKATTEIFHSTQPGPSDNKITMETKFEGFNTADILIQTTNKDSYVFFISNAKNWEDMTEEEMIQKLQGRDMSNFMHSGNFYASIESNELKPGMNYIAFAYGYANRTITTGLTTLKFRTHDVDETDKANVSIEHDKYFKTSELKELYPEMFGNLDEYYTVIKPIHISVSGEQADGATTYYAFYPGDYTGDVINFYDMITEIYKYGGMDTHGFFYFPQDWLDMKYTMLALVKTDDGHFGNLYRELFTVTESGISPAAEYQPLLPAPSFKAFHWNGKQANNTQHSLYTFDFNTNK